jgi:hypothetical protein
MPGTTRWITLRAQHHLQEPPMHLELPKARIHSVREFLKHYLMIVLSILTALGLEAWIEHAHHREAATTASEQIEGEIRTNLIAVRDAVAQNDKSLVSLKAFDALVTDDLKKGMPSAAINQAVRANGNGSGKMHFGIVFPTLLREAWDVAVANQSASWLDSASLKQYSGVYTAQREVNLSSTEATTFLDGPRAVNLMADLELGDVDPRDLLHVIRQEILTISSLQYNLKQLEGQLSDAAAARGKA